MVPKPNATNNEIAAFPQVLNNMGELPNAPGPSVPNVQTNALVPYQTAVQVRNACKSYGGTPVLKNFDMTVPQGTIYSLLGASGCGKTTMLSCIVGIRKLDSGDIFVFGQRPGTPESGIPGRRLGYMPQDIALYPNLSIKEMLQYFGRIYGMTHTEILGRIEFLSNFLDLPPSSRRIGDLSGGQQRRVSLSTCLLHEPSLLILDEPTVGTDPLLRESIWNYLCDLVSKKHVTVIITTHYIEEARQSHTVGLMRNGRLLTEKSPESLLEEHHAVLLEEIVLKLCRNDVSGFDDPHAAEVRQTLEESSFYAKKRGLKSAIMSERKEEPAVVGLKFKQTLKDENQNQNDGKDENVVKIEIGGNGKVPGVPARPRQLKRTQSLRMQATQGIWGRFSRIRAIVMRNTLTLLRTPIFMLAIFFMPSFQVIVTNLTVGPEPKHMAFGVVNPEINNDLSKCDLPRNKCGTDTLSCKYIKALPNNIIDPVAISSPEEGLEGVKSGRLWGYMEFPKNYSQFLVARAATNIFADNATLDGSTISFRMDHSHYFAAALLTKSFYETFLSFVKGTLEECDQDPHKADLPLFFRKPVYGTLDITFHDYIAPAVLVIILFFIPYLSCAVYNITDRKQGTLDRSMVAGITMSDLLSGFFITEGCLILIQTMIAYLLVIFIFQMEIKGPVIGFLLITVMTGVAGLSLGFLIAQLVDEEIEALITGVGFYMPNLIFCGIIWPLEAAPWYIRCISYCLPGTWAISTVRSIISRGWGMSHPYVWPGYAVLMAWILGSWLLAAIAFRRRSK